MKIKVYVLILLAGVLALRGASRLAVVYAVAAPHASKGTILKLMFNPPYEIASPHQGLVQDVESKLFPTVYASCPVGDCDVIHSSPQLTPNPACSGTYGNCPNCVSGPCAIYMCTAAVTSQGCNFLNNTNPSCSTCRNDRPC